MKHYYLVADDDQDTQFLIRKAFGNLGLSVPLQFVNDGEEVIDYLEGRGGFNDRETYPMPGLILLDLKMPRKNGLDVLEWIRESPFREIVVVMFSGSDVETDVREAYRLGVNSFIHKPTSFSDFQHVLSAVHHYWFGCNYIPCIAGDGLIGREKTPFKIIAQ